MALDDGDKAICAEIAREIVEEVAEKLLRMHMETCPHGKLIARSKIFFIGALIGSSVGSSGLVLAVAKALGAL